MRAECGSALVGMVLGSAAVGCATAAAAAATFPPVSRTLPSPIPMLQRHVPNIGFFQPIGADPLHGTKLPKHAAM